MWLQSTICPACFHKHGCEDRTRRKDGMDRQHIVVHVWLQSRSDHDSDGIQTCWRFFHHEWNLRESAITDQHGNHYCSGHWGTSRNFYNCQINGHRLQFVVDHECLLTKKQRKAGISRNRIGIL